MANGAPTEAANFWKGPTPPQLIATLTDLSCLTLTLTLTLFIISIGLSEADQKLYTEPDFVKKQLKWGSVTVQNWEKFLRSRYRPT